MYITAMNSVTRAAVLAAAAFVLKITIRAHRDNVNRPSVQKATASLFEKLNSFFPICSRSTRGPSRPLPVCPLTPLPPPPQQPAVFASRSLLYTFTRGNRINTSTDPQMATARCLAENNSTTGNRKTYYYYYTYNIIYKRIRHHRLPPKLFVYVVTTSSRPTRVV